MITTLQVLALLLRLPVCWQDRHETERTARLETIAEAIASAANETTRPRDTGAFLVSLAWHESGLCRAVHAGERHGTGEGLWQLVPLSKREPPFSGLDPESTAHAAGEAAWVVTHSYLCGPSIKSRMIVYITGGSGCPSDWLTAAARVRTYWWAYGRLGTL